jgi:hypothetical protein
MTRPALPDLPLRGGCLCGAVRYDYRARPLALNACHCIDCKRLSGGSYFAVVQGEAAHLVHSGETLVFRKTADSGRQVDIHRCAQCGTRLWHVPVSAPHFRFFPAGTLDDSTWFVATSHIFTRSAQPDVLFAPDALVVAGPPDDRQAIWDAFNRCYPA